MNDRRCGDRAEPRAPSLPFRIRPVCEADYGFVIGWWLESLHSDSPVHRHMRFTTLKRDVRPEIRESVDRDLVLVACDRDDADRLLGFVVVQNGTLLYGWVRPRLRGHGIGLALLLEAEAQSGPVRYYTTPTRDGVRWARRRQWEMRARAA